MKKLDKKYMQEFSDIKKNCIKYHKKVNQRIGYIITEISKLFNDIVYSWKHYDDFFEHYDEKFIYDLYIEKADIDDDWLVDLGGTIGEISLNRCLPAHWLFEDFLEELKEAKARFEKKQEEQLKAFKDAGFRKKLIESAKKKLTEAEIKAIWSFDDT